MAVEHKTDRDRGSRELWVCHLGVVPYREALAMQEAIRARRQAGELPDTLLLLEHPPVYTRGRRSRPDELALGEDFYAARGIEVIPTDRGGRVTYHGPGQLVGYPVVDLTRLGLTIPGYIEALEGTLIAYLAELGVESEPGGHGLTGVWSGGKKVAAIGIKLNRPVVSHGFALNLTTDLGYFEGIVPCGHAELKATSVGELTGRRIEVRDAAEAYARHFERVFDVALDWVAAERLRKVGPVA